MHLAQPLRFLPLFFTTLFDPLGGDVAVATAERVSPFPTPFPATGGKLGISQRSSTIQRGIRRTWTSSHRSVEHSGPVLGSAELPAIPRDPSFSTAMNQEGKREYINDVLTII